MDTGKVAWTRVRRLGHYTGYPGVIHTCVIEESGTQIPVKTVKINWPDDED